MLMIGLSLMSSETGTAPVGFGLAIGMPPNEAQVPTDTMAAAPLAASCSRSRLVLPAMVE